MERKVKERWIGQLAFMAVWAVLFGGVATFVAVGDPNAPWFLWLFPVAAVVVAGLLLRRVLRAGFVVSSEGVSGTHELGDELLGWDTISAFDWEPAGSTSSSGSRRSSYQLVAATDHGAVQVTSLQASSRGARQIMQALAGARDDGIIPERIEVHPPPTMGQLLRQFGAAVTGQQRAATMPESAEPPAADGPTEG